MKTIHYTMADYPFERDCQTTCLYCGDISKFSIKVGSTYCTTKCELFIKHDKDKRIVYCNGNHIGTKY